MNYKKIYDQLILRGQTRTLNEYSERHHIIPRCMGGTDEPENLVRLTPEEHYVAHQLLVKIHPNNHDLVRAATFMTTHSTDARVNNKLFGWLRRKSSSAMSVFMTEYLKDNDHPRGMSGKINTAESNTKRRKALKGRPSHSKGKKNPKLSQSKKGKAPRKLITRLFDRREMDIQNFIIWCNNEDDPLAHRERNKRRGDKQRGKIQVQRKIECPHCHKIGGESVMRRWHFENCKYKEQNQ
jgi:hypothetical protein